MAVSAFEYSNPRVERIVFGRGVVKQLADEVRRLGASRVFVVTSPSIARSYLLDAVRSALGDLCVGVFDTVQPHSPTDSIGVAAKQAADASADAFVSVGGGSSIDTARGMAALPGEGRPLRTGHPFLRRTRRKCGHAASKMPQSRFRPRSPAASTAIPRGWRKGVQNHPGRSQMSPRTRQLIPKAAQTAPAKAPAAPA